MLFVTRAGADCNGWKVVSDGLDIDIDDSTSSIMALEFKSCVGPAALAINLAQPFIDDLKLELIYVGMGIDENEDKDNVDAASASSSWMVKVKSSSRMGSSDLFVNKKRLEYLGASLQQKGWSVPKIKYGYQ